MDGFYYIQNTVQIRLRCKISCLVLRCSATMVDFLPTHYSCQPYHLVTLVPQSWSSQVLRLFCPRLSHSYGRSQQGSPGTISHEKLSQTLLPAKLQDRLWDRKLGTRLVTESLETTTNQDQWPSKFVCRFKVRTI